MKKYVELYANRTSMRHRVNAIVAVLLSVVMIVGMASGIVPAILPILKHAQAAETDTSVCDGRLSEEFRRHRLRNNKPELRELREWF